MMRRDPAPDARLLPVECCSAPITPSTLTTAGHAWVAEYRCPACDRGRVAVWAWCDDPEKRHEDVTA